MGSIKKTIVVDDTPDMSASEMTRSDGTPILVEAAKRDAEGNLIAGTYAKKIDAQAPLHSGYNIKTVNGISVLGPGNIEIDLEGEIERATKAERTIADAVNDHINETDDHLDQLDDSVSSLGSAMSDMAKTGQAMDAGIQASISKEIDDRENADETLRSNINAEADRAKGVEQSIADSVNDYINETDDHFESLDGSISSLTTSIDDLSKKEAADVAGIQTSIAKEIDDRESNDDALQSSVDAEIARAKSAEESISRSLTQEISDRRDAIYEVELSVDTEKYRAQREEQDIQSNVDSESAERQSADAELRTGITAESSRAQAAEKTLSESLAEEASARGSADSDLQSKIDAEAARAKGIEQSIADSVNEYINETNRHLESLDGSASSLAASIDDLSKRESADVAGIQTSIAAEINNRKTADDTLQSGINAEASARGSADSDLQSKIDAEAARAQAAEKTLTDSVSAESSARQTAIETLQSNINAEASARQTNDETLQSGVDAINAMIPGQATASNQLADKDYVNSSIATATATFRGTVSSLSDLRSLSGDSNDYAFVEAKDESTGLTSHYDRYKYSDALSDETGNWAFEYTLNNSSFTSEQWKAITSGITSDLVAKISANSADIATNAVNLAMEKTERARADSDLRSNVDTESSRAQAAEKTLSESLAEEASARGSADSDLQSKIDAEASERKKADEALQSGINTETARAKEAEEKLTTNLSAESTARQAGDDDVLSQAKDYSDSNFVNLSEEQSITGIKHFKTNGTDIDNAVFYEADTFLLKPTYIKVNNSDKANISCFADDTTFDKPARGNYDIGGDSSGNILINKQYADGNYVDLTTSQTIAGEKHFVTGNTSSANAVFYEDGTVFEKKTTINPGNAANANIVCYDDATAFEKKTTINAGNTSSANAVFYEDGTVFEGKPVTVQGDNMVIKAGGTDLVNLSMYSADTILEKPTVIKAGGGDSVNINAGTDDTYFGKPVTLGSASKADYSVTSSSDGKTIANKDYVDATAEAQATEKANAEQSRAQDVENTLQKAIDAINASQNFVATYATKADMPTPPVSGLESKDCVLVLKDESHQDQAYVYKYNSAGWEEVGPLGDYYTKAHVDAEFAKTNGNVAYYRSQTESYAKKVDTYTNSTDDKIAELGKVVDTAKDAYLASTPTFVETSSSTEESDVTPTLVGLFAETGSETQLSE